MTNSHNRHGKITSLKPQMIQLTIDTRYAVHM